MNTPSYFSIDNLVTNTTVGVHELENISNISLFPNPAKESVTINYASKTDNTLHIRLFDMTGKEIMQAEQQNSVGPNMIQLETSALEAGIYFMQLNDGTSSKRIKFIKL